MEVVATLLLIASSVTSGESQYRFDRCGVLDSLAHWVER